MQAVSGDLGRIQQQASSSGRGLPPGALLISTGSLRTGLGQGRGHLEANMAAALALQSPQEYKRWLSTYASHLAGNSCQLWIQSLLRCNSHTACACLSKVLLLQAWQGLKPMIIEQSKTNQSKAVMLSGAQYMI